MKIATLALLFLGAYGVSYGPGKDSVKADLNSEVYTNSLGSFSFFKRALGSRNNNSACMSRLEVAKACRDGLKRPGESSSDCMEREHRENERLCRAAAGASTTDPAKAKCDKASDEMDEAISKFTRSCRGRAGCIEMALNCQVCDVDNPYLAELLGCPGAEEAADAKEDMDLARERAEELSLDNFSALLSRSEQFAPSIPNPIQNPTEPRIRDVSYKYKYASCPPLAQKNFEDIQQDLKEALEDKTDTKKAHEDAKETLKEAQEALEEEQQAFQEAFKRLEDRLEQAVKDATEAVNRTRQEALEGIRETRTSITLATNDLNNIEAQYRLALLEIENVCNARAQAAVDEYRQQRSAARASGTLAVSESQLWSGSKRGARNRENGVRIQALRRCHQDGTYKNQLKAAARTRDTQVQNKKLEIKMLEEVLTEQLIALQNQTTLPEAIRELHQEVQKAAERLQQSNAQNMQRLQSQLQRAVQRENQAKQIHQKAKEDAEYLGKVEASARSAGASRQTRRRDEDGPLELFDIAKRKIDIAIRDCGCKAKSQKDDQGRTVVKLDPHSVCTQIYTQYDNYNKKLEEYSAPGGSSGSGRRRSR